VIIEQTKYDKQDQQGKAAFNEPAINTVNHEHNKIFT
jgi:hypothetical protein